MILAGTAALLMLVFGEAADAAPPGERVYAQVTVRQQVIVRMPARGRVIQPAGASLVQWREGRGPRCVQARSVAGATALGHNSVDLVLRDNSRVRARLESNCPGLDFYQGFYVNGTQDGLICADRDSIRSRMGGQCEIERFSTLTAVRP
ncbi:MAG TPA: hypothetical protein VGB08_08555 [Allosphingosinicella sp.]|jgi:hypothetical protein